jgi:hypothetical protein
MTEKILPIEIDKKREKLVMKHLLSYDNNKHGLCRTFFSLPYHHGTTQIILKFWEKIGNNLGRKNITNNGLNYMKNKKGEIKYV